MTPQALLGSILDGGASPSAAIGHKFTDKNQQAVADIIATQYATGKAVDALTIRQILKDGGHDTRVLSDLLDASANAYFEEGDYPTPSGEGVTPTKDIKVISLEELLMHEFPPRENILAPWLPSQGVAMVYAGRGIGKTFFGLSVGLASSSGGTFLKWQAERPRGVLLIDGEMPGAVLQERAAAFVAASPLPPGDFRVITPDMQPGHRSIDLTRVEDQEAIEQHLEGVSLIIVDNLSTLCRTGRENEGEGWLPVQEWALRQRAKGRSVLFIHHAGKGGNQRGTSRREDILDTVIALRRPAKYTPDMGALFEIHFEKSRGIFGDDVEPIEASLITAEDGSLSWAYRSVELSTYDKVVELLKEGMSVTDIATELEINKSTASRHARKAKSNGDFNG